MLARAIQIRKETGSRIPILTLMIKEQGACTFPFCVQPDPPDFAAVASIAILCAAFFAQTANPEIQPINSALAIVMP